MLTVLVFWKHAPADCPAHNEKWRKPMFEIASKQDELTAKHGIKTVGGWHVHAEHLIVQVFEVPSYEAFQSFLMEPVVMNMLSFHNTEIKVATTLEETAENMQRMMQAQ